ncbi:MAG: type II/IV secretion system ATPase subunit [Candidatus Hydrothermarchaeota archaeon]
MDIEERAQEILEKIKKKETELSKSKLNNLLNQIKEQKERKAPVLPAITKNENYMTKIDTTYPLIEPYAFANIHYDRESHELIYEVKQPELNEDEEKALKKIKETLIDELELDFFSVEELDKYLCEKVDEVVKKHRIRLSENSREKIKYYIIRDFAGLEIIEPLMNDVNIEDISCDGANIPIYIYHRMFGSMRTNLQFSDSDELDSFIIKIAQRSGKHISVAEPLLEGTLPDGSRVQLTYGKEISRKGSTFTIRKFRGDPMTPPDLIELGTASPELLAYLWLAIEHDASVLVAGGIAAGKTTTLNALSLFIPPELKIVTIEDTPELSLPHSNWIPQVTRSGFGPALTNGRRYGEIDMFDLLKTALRQRPDYIIVGEVRGVEANTLFQAMATGHLALSTIHADSPQGVIHRLESPPINIPRVLLQNLDIIVMQVRSRVKGKYVRRIKGTTEIVGLDPNTQELITNDTFKWDPHSDKHHFVSSRSYLMERIMADMNISEEEMRRELENRKNILEWMKNRGIRKFTDVARVVATYYKSPETVLEDVWRYM